MSQIETPVQTVQCPECLERVPVSETNGHRECLACGELRGNCSGCDNRAYLDGLDRDGYCAECIANQEEEDEGFAERPYSSANLPQFQSRGRGKYIKSGRIFSAEIECYYPNNRALDALDQIPRGVGIASDGSLDNRGIELQTPKLKGAQGEKQVKAICKILSGAGFFVDRSTGLHIHLDGRGLLPRVRGTQEPIALKQLWYFYHLFDGVILSFLPTSRRANHYCKSTKLVVHQSKIAAIKTLREAEELWYATKGDYNLKYRKDHKYDTSRYAGINLHPLFSEKHAEIRFHGGTLNPIKILNWVALHQAVLDKAANHELDIQEMQRGADYCMDMPARTTYLFQLLELPERTQKYFLERQKAFAKSQESEGEVLEGITEQN